MGGTEAVVLHVYSLGLLLSVATFVPLSPPFFISTPTHPFDGQAGKRADGRPSALNWTFGLLSEGKSLKLLHSRGEGMNGEW